MSDVLITSRVETNIDRLSAMAVRRLLEKLVDNVADSGERLLRVNVPKDSGAMAENVDRTAVERAEEIIRAAVGVKPIDIENRRFQTGTKDLFTPGEQSSRNYPLFVNRGTGIFGPAHAPIHARRSHVMRWDSEGGIFYRTETKGQPAQHFMLDTYEQIRRAVLPMEIELLKARIKDLPRNPIVT